MLALTLTGCTATMRQNHPEDIPQWWTNYRGPHKHLNVILEGDPADDREFFQGQCDALGGIELIPTTDRNGNVLRFTCGWVDY
jgi:hypothetical protein